MDEITIKIDDDAEWDEWYMQVYDCPKCKERIAIESNYCHNCGVKINWIEDE